MKNIAYRKNSNIVVRQENKDVILFNPDNADIVVINETGSFVWSRCNGKNTLADIAKELYAVFATTFERASKDTQKFSSILAARNFVQKVT